MAFAVEPYIFDWIFFDDSSELKNLAVLIYTKVGNKMSAFGVYPHHRLARCMRYIIRRGLSVLLIQELGSQGLDTG